MNKLSILWGLLSLIIILSVSSCKSDDDDTHTVLGTVELSTDCGYVINTANGYIIPNNFDPDFGMYQIVGATYKIHYGDNFYDEICSVGKGRSVYLITIEEAP